MRRPAPREQGAVSLAAGEIVLIQTRSMTDKDLMCCNQELCRQPLTRWSHAMLVIALLSQLSVSGLDVKWHVTK